MTLRLMQRRGQTGIRFVLAAVDDRAWIVQGVDTVLTLATRAIEQGIDLATAVARCGDAGSVEPEAELVAGRLLAPIDHPEPARLRLSGTGLTHLGSAEGRDRMHRAVADGGAVTDSMRMFLEGVEGGKPADGRAGQQPEWFYKGDGSSLVGPGQPLVCPDFALDAGEEPELAGVYLVGPDGTPFRLGVCLANEFSDHVTERHNYLWLAHSKLRQAALGPELLVGGPPESVEGISRILRDGRVVWQKPFLTGEANMSHSIANLEHHHFKYDQFRRPGDIHVHFFGTATLSFSDGVATQPGDEFEIAAAPFRLPLRNEVCRRQRWGGVVRAL